MSHVAGTISLGSLADWLARAAGWSPVGRTVTLHGAEGPCANLFSGLAGAVDSLDRGVMVIREARRDGGDQQAPAQLRLTPRHRGWTPYSMMLARIAVVAEIVDANGNATSTTIAIASLDRGRK